MYTKVVINVKEPRGLEEDNYNYYKRYVAFKGKSPEEVAQACFGSSFNKYTRYELSELTDEFRELINCRLGISSWNFDYAYVWSEPNIDLYVMGKDKNGQFLSIKR